MYNSSGPCTLQKIPNLDSPLLFKVCSLWNIDIGENRSERMIAVVIISKEIFKTLSGVIAPIRDIASISCNKSATLEDSLIESSTTAF